MSFDNNPTGKLTTKVSSLIDGQLPDFIQAAHPIFSRFLKHYYQYLEAGELRLTVDIDNLLLELIESSNVLDVDGASSNEIRITAIPDSKDIVPVRNQIVEIDFINTSITGEVDTVAVGDSAAGTTYTPTSSYTTTSSF